MNWIQSLYATFENNTHVVGQFQENKRGREYALMPVGHTTQTAHIEVVLDENGNLRTARATTKETASTMIPCTEDAASRTSAPVPYPLFDKLQYVAGDFEQYVPKNKVKIEKKKTGSSKENLLSPHADYMRQLRAWCDSASGHPKVKAVYRYLEKGTLIHDLIVQQVLYADANGTLLEKWSNDREGTKPDIFKVLTSDQSSAFVRFAVEYPGEPESRLWRDESVQQSFIQFYKRQLGESELCYVTGQHLPYSEKHTSRIRNSGDKAKLISSNDKDGFTYRGRFRNSLDAAVISYDVSQKAHNALKWLVERQGISIDNKVFLVWGTQQLDVPETFADSYDVCVQAGEIQEQEWTVDTWQGQHEEESEALRHGDATHKEFAKQIRKAIYGFHYDGDYQSDVIVMILNAATPGRLSILYYQDLKRNIFLERLQQWHETCFWQHRYRKTEAKERIVFTGAPSTRDIAWAAYGPQTGDKWIKEIMERMLPCIIQGRRIPQDIVRSSFQRASNPVSMEQWEWEKTLSITCALINKEHQGEGLTVALDTQLEDRSYLFGRMLAIADVLERRALGKEEKRASNAIRYMSAFAKHPMKTWMIIQENLLPYQNRLGTAATYYNMLLSEVGSKISPQDFNDKALTGLYLLGFYSQRNDLYTSKKIQEVQPDSLDDESNEYADSDEKGSE